MRVLEKKTSVEIAQELAKESPEVGGNFGEKLGELLEKNGYDPKDQAVRKAVLSAYFDVRR